MKSRVLVGALALGFLAAFVAPEPAAGAQVCGCKNSSGRLRRVTATPPPLTCPGTWTLVCWNEDPPPGDISVQCGGVDDTAAVDQAVAAALAARVPLRLPAGQCRYSSTITLTKMIPIIGMGRDISSLVYCGNGDAILVNPPDDRSDNIGHQLRDFSVSPCTPGGGDNGIEVNLRTNALYAYADYERVTIGDFGGYGLWWNNAGDNTDGFFNINVRSSFIRNGLKGTLIGDSVTLRDTVVHGKNNVRITGVLGARLLQILGGQITTINGFLSTTDVSGMRIERVWMEHPSYIAQPPPGLSGILIEGGVDNQIIGCVMGVGDPTSEGFVPYAHNIALVGADFTKILETSFTNRASAAHIYGTSTTTNTLIRDNHYNNVAPLIVLQGS
jgi:hypothetical protein